MFKETKLKDTEKKGALSDFLKKNPSSSFWLACHAALPLFFRQEWLFHLWANFRNLILLNTRYDVKYYEIVNVVNAPFTNKIGIGIYEFDKEIRDYLLFELQQQFGNEHVRKLATFLYQYAEKNTTNSTEKETHQAVAWSILDPKQVIAAISKAFNRAVEQNDELELLRLHYAIENISSPIIVDKLKSLKNLESITSVQRDLIEEIEQKDIIKKLILSYDKENENAVAIKLSKNLKEVVSDYIYVQPGITDDIDVVKELEKKFGSIFRRVEFDKIKSSNSIAHEYAIENGRVTGIRLTGQVGVQAALEEIISLLVKFTELTYFKSNFSRSSDFSFLNEFKNLATLDLGDNNIADISELAPLTSVEELMLDGNPISDIKSIGNLINLKKLLLNGCKTVDVSPLRNLINLQELVLDGNLIVDIGPLKNLFSLKKLILNGNKIIDISSLTNLTRLEELIIDGNKISDISSLKNLLSLKKLVLNGNKISDISAFEKLTSLEELILDGNRISDISPLKELTSLKRLILNGNQIKDVSSLSKLENLTELNIAFNQIKDITSLSNQYHKQEFVAYIEGNPIIRPPQEVITEGIDKIKEWFQKNSQENERPSSINANLFRCNICGEKWLFFIGIIDGKPYEIYSVNNKNDDFPIPDSVSKGNLIFENKTKKVRCDFRYTNKYGFHITIEDILYGLDKKYSNYTKLLTKALNNGMPISRILEFLSAIHLDDETDFIWKQNIEKCLKNYIDDVNGEQNSIWDSIINKFIYRLNDIVNPIKVRVKLTNDEVYDLDIEEAISFDKQMGDETRYLCNIFTENKYEINIEFREYPKITANSVLIDKPDLIKTKEDELLRLFQQWLSNRYEQKKKEPTIFNILKKKEELDNVSNSESGSYTDNENGYITGINLSGLELVELPKEIADLKLLQVLNLSNNQLSDVSTLKDLKRLKNLDLSYNNIFDITQLPKSENLTFLSLHANRHINEISNLTNYKNLETLYLSYNKIENISPLSELTNLIELSLLSNNIKDISALKNLTHLNYLNLGGNIIENIDALKDLKHLKTLGFVDCRIERLPEWICDFDMDFTDERAENNQLREGFISFMDNPLKEPSIEILVRGKETVKKWFIKERQSALISKLEKRIPQLTGGNFIKEWKLENNNNKLSVYFFNDYEKFRKANPEGIPTFKEYRDYFITSDHINKILMKEPVRLLKDFDELDLIYFNLPFGIRKYEIEINREQIEKYLNLTFSELKNNEFWQSEFIDKIAYNKEKRKDFVNQFIKQIREVNYPTDSSIYVFLKGESTIYKLDLHEFDLKSDLPEDKSLYVSHIFHSEGERIEFLFYEKNDSINNTVFIDYPDLVETTQQEILEQFQRWLEKKHLVRKTPVKTKIDFLKFDEEKYDAPVKAQISQSILVTGNFTKEELENQIHKYAEELKPIESEYHKEQTHLYLYFFDKKSRASSNWFVMYQYRKDAIEKVDFNENLLKLFYIGNNLYTLPKKDETKPKKFATIKEALAEFNDFRLSEGTLKFFSENHIQISDICVSGESDSIIKENLRRSLIYVIFQIFIHTDINNVIISSVPLKIDFKEKEKKEYLFDFAKSISISRDVALVLLKKHLKINDFDELVEADNNNSINRNFNRILYSDSGNPTLDVIWKEFEPFLIEYKYPHIKLSSQKNDIEKLIQIGKLKKAIKELSIRTKEIGQKELESKLTLLHSWHYSIEREKKEGFLSSEKYKLEYEKIVKNLLEYNEQYNLLINSESNSVGADDTDYYDPEIEIVQGTIKGSVKQLEWDYKNKVIIIYDEIYNQPSTIKSLDNLVFYIEEEIVQALTAEMPIHWLKEIADFNYTDEVREYLYKNCRKEIEKLGWGQEL